MFRFTLRSLLTAATVTPPALAGTYYFLLSLGPVGVVTLLLFVSFFVATWLPVLILSVSASRLPFDRDQP